MFMRLFLLLLLTSCSVFHTKQSRQSEYVLTNADKVLTLKSKDTSRIMFVFSRVLKDEGYAILKDDVASGTLEAANEKLDEMGKFNRSMNGGSNYKISETFQLSLKIQTEYDASQVFMNIKRTDKFSMGQEEVEEVNDLDLYQKIFTKVKLEVL